MVAVISYQTPLRPLHTRLPEKCCKHRVQSCRSLSNVSSIKYLLRQWIRLIARLIKSIDSIQGRQQSDAMFSFRRMIYITVNN